MQEGLCSDTAYVQPDDVQGRWCDAEGRAAETCNTGGNTEHGLGSTAVLRRLRFPKMLTLDPPVRCGAEKFSSPEQYGLLQSHSGEEKSETWQNSYPLMATILLVPHLRAQLGCSLGPKILPAKTRQHETPDCHTCAPPRPVPFLAAPSSLALPSTTGKSGRTTDGGTDAEGLPISGSAPQDTGGGCIEQVFWGFTSPH